ncbi:MAG TPA: hypothetical protein VGP03_05715 [Pseudonocardiaceae bacterium]|nr:hypothetical protein [Pseudonocardiaceae bacterium]
MPHLATREAYVRLHHLYPAVPAIALLLMPFLPFVNTDALWFGLPRMLVWGGVWCVLLTPAFLLSERGLTREEDGEDL